MHQQRWINIVVTKLFRYVSVWLFLIIIYEDTEIRHSNKLYCKGKKNKNQHQN